MSGRLPRACPAVHRRTVSGRRKSCGPPSRGFASRCALVQTSWLSPSDQELPADKRRELVEALAAGGVDVEDVRNELDRCLGRLLTGLKFWIIPGYGDVASSRARSRSPRACGEKVSTLSTPDPAEGSLNAQRDEGVP